MPEGPDEKERFGLELAEAMKIYDRAKQLAKESKLPGSIDGPQDAYRHIVAAALLTQHFGPDAVRIASVLSETLERVTGHNTRPAGNMDVHNNSFGVGLGLRARSEAEIDEGARHAILDENGEATWLTPYRRSWLRDQASPELPKHDNQEEHPAPKHDDQSEKHHEPGHDDDDNDDDDDDDGETGHHDDGAPISGPALARPDDDGGPVEPEQISLASILAIVQSCQVPEPEIVRILSDMDTNDFYGSQVHEALAELLGNHGAPGWLVGMLGADTPEEAKAIFERYLRTQSFSLPQLQLQREWSDPVGPELEFKSRIQNKKSDDR